MHGGSIEALSAGAGLGSTFIVRVPIADQSQLPHSSRTGGFFGITWPAMHHSAPAQHAVAHEPHARILVVDDNELAAQGLCKLLGMRGFAASPVYTGEDALARLSELSPDAIILDIGLPGMSGYEVAQQLRSAYGYTGAVIALTGYGQEKDRQKALEAGCDYHLVKPVGLAEVESVLKEALSGVRLQASVRSQK
jgi:CheY-like chemotaxis protein